MPFTQQDLDKFAFIEMFTHTPICSHPNPKDILIVGKNNGLSDEIEKHIGINSTLKDESSLKDIDESSFDIVLVNTKVDRVAIGHINRVLRSDGVVILSPKSFIDEKEVFIEELKDLSEIFKIVMPYRVDNSIIRQAYFAFASKKYHPTADIILQRAELIDGLNYYNSNIHLSSFELPNYVYQEVKDITKR